ncbi:MAG: DUF4340 domain-containing protein [Firmicutes bacterium]|nr:DUF4340 domain-containing protein [Bacillota bacterium]
MSEKRKRHELKLILILAVASLLLFGGAACFNLLLSQNEQDDLMTALNMKTNIKTMGVSDGADAYEMVKEKGDWYNPAEENTPVNKTLVGTMANVFNDLSPDRAIIEGGQYFAQFGLEQPQYVIKTIGDGEEKTYLIGDFNPILQQYYVAMEGADTVYLVAKSDVEKTMKTFLNLVAPPTLEWMNASDITAYGVEGPEGAFRAYLVGEVYRFDTEDGESYDGDAYGATNIFYNLKKLPCDNCVSYDADAQDMRKYGLDEPNMIFTLELAEGDPYVVKVAQAKDKSAYLNAGGNTIVYQITEEEYESIAKMALLSQFIEK